MWRWLRHLLGFCRHDWQERGRTYAPPLRELSLLYEISLPLRRFEAAMGLTTVLYECGACRRHKVVKMLGAEKEAKAGELRLIRSRSRGPYGRGGA